MSDTTVSTPNTRNDKLLRAVVFACRWCAMLGADRAGLERTDLPSLFRLIPVECAAAVEPDLILRAFADGLDGVAVLGCHLGGCRHNEANRAAKLRLTLLQDILDSVGLDRRRLLLSWGTAHEGSQFAGLVRGFAATLDALPGLAPRPDVHGGFQEQGRRESGWPGLLPAQSLDGSPSLPDPEPGVLASIRQQAATMLTDNGLVGILGLVESKDLGGSALPHILTKPEQAAGLVAGPKWPLAKTAWRLARELPPGRSLGLVCRGCDARAIVEMEKFNQLRPGTVLPISLSCSPAQAQACRCATPFPPGADPGPGIDLPGIEDMQSLTAGPDRLDRWQAHFSRCLKCYGCRNVCPVCTCPTCKLEEDAYVPLGGLPPDPLAFHLIRAMHVADRCVACGACQDSCPSGLPLLALHQAARRALQDRTGYLSGSSEPSPLLLAGRREGPLGMAQPQWTDTLSGSTLRSGGPGGSGRLEVQRQAGGCDHG